MSDEIVIHHIEPSNTDEEQIGELPVDIYKTEENITIITLLSGVKKEKLFIRVNENILIISGTRTSPLLENGNYVVKECFWGKFSRMIVLPSKVKITDIKAVFKDGILTVHIPLMSEPKEKIIPIFEE